MASRRLSVALAAVLSGAAWAVFLAPGSGVSAPADGMTVRASVADGSDGAEAPDGGFQTAVSGNGRYAAFVSTDNLADYYQGPDHGNGGQRTVYVRDLQTDRTVQISVGTGGAGRSNGTAPNGASFFPSLSRDGRYVSFVTRASNIAGPIDEGATVNVVVCDRDQYNSGTLDGPVDNSPFPGLRCVKVASEHNVDSPPRLSGDGSRIVFSDYHSQPSAPVSQFVYTAEITKDSNGDFVAPTVHQLPYVDAQNNYFNQYEPAISADGFYIVYVRRVAASFGTFWAIYETALGAGAAPGNSERADLAPAGSFVGTTSVEVAYPSVSGDGGLVAFSAPQPDVQLNFAGAKAAADPPAADNPQVYVANLNANTVPSVLESRTSGGSGSDPGSGQYPVLSADGRYLAFVTDRSDVFDGTSEPGGPCLTYADPRTPENTDCQVVVRDLDRDFADARFGEPFDPAFLASNACEVANPCAGNADSTNPSLSDDGGRIGFDSDASDLVGDDNNASCEEGEEGFCSGGTDSFVRAGAALDGSDLAMNPARVGQSSTGSYQIRATGFGPITVDDVRIDGADADQFSVDASTCAGNTLHQGDTCTVYVTFRPTTEGDKTATIEVFAGGAADPAHTNTVTATARQQTRPTVNPGDIVRTSVGTGDPGEQAPDGGGSSMISGNGDYDVFVSTDALDGGGGGGTSNIFVHDLRTNVTHQISLGGDVDSPKGVVTPDGSMPNGDSGSPSISADGRFVSFETAATNIVPTDDDETPSTAVVCDRDPDGDGVFDERRPIEDGTAPDYRCVAAYSAGPYAQDLEPRLAPDGHHLAWVGCSEEPTDGCFSTYEIVVARLAVSAGQGLHGFTERTVIADGDFAPDVGAVRYQPQVSDEGISDIPHAVRVVYAANYYHYNEGGPGDGEISGIFVADAFGPQDISIHRVDRRPKGSGFVGDVDPNDRYAQVGDPSMTDEGLTVVFDRTDLYTGLARAYMVDVNGAGTAGHSRYVSVTNAGRPVRAADPALSGDGRYVSYVTDDPDFDGSAQSMPFESCLVQQSEDLHAADAPASNGACQIVARDVQTDRRRARAGQPPLPDALVSVSGQPGCPAFSLYGSNCGGDGDSSNPSMDEHGGRVGFDSFADDLVDGDTNLTSAAGNEPSDQDAFVRTFGPTLTAPALVDFGHVKIGTSSSQSVPLGVDGFGPYELDDPAVGGRDPHQFSATGGTCALPGQVLHAGETCFVTATYKPWRFGGLAKGLITLPGRNNPIPGSFQVRGFGDDNTTAAQFGADPSPVDFGSGIPLDKPGKSQVVTISNSGGNFLDVTGLSLHDTTVPGAAGDYRFGRARCSGGDSLDGSGPPTCCASYEFTDPGGFLLPPGVSCNIKIVWVGRAVGPRPAVLQVDSDGPGAPNFVDLTALVPAPTVTVNPGVIHTGQVTTVTGTGFAPGRIVAVVTPEGGESAVARTNEHGAFDTGLVIFPGGMAGPRTVTAHTEHASRSISAEAPLLVQLATLQSPTLVIRHG